jgi:hypothetical protein
MTLRELSSAGAGQADAIARGVVRDEPMLNLARLEAPERVRFRAVLACKRRARAT